MSAFTTVPLSQRERSAQIDMMRGVALLGVLLVNLSTSFRISLFAHILGLDSPIGPAGEIASKVLSIFIEFKAITLFSFLFGVGIGVQAKRLSERANIHLFLVRRFTVLFLLGAIHGIFIWNGDILTLYALCGWVVIPMLSLSARAITIIGIALIISSAYLEFPFRLPDTATLRAHAEMANQVYSEGSFQQILSFRFAETRHLIIPLLLMTVLRTLGIVLLGLAVQRSGLMRLVHKRLATCFISGSIAGLGATCFGLDVLAMLSISLVYVSAILLWVRSAPPLAAGGQMALSNYLSQSVVFGVIFYGYGFKQFGKLGLLGCTLGGLVFYSVQLALSQWWLNRFYFGPCEWLWRSLTYGRRQPMIRRSAEGGS